MVTIFSFKMLEFFNFVMLFTKKIYDLLEYIICSVFKSYILCYLCCQNIILRLTAQQQQHQTETKLSLSQVVHFGIMICQKHAEYYQKRKLAEAEFPFPVLHYSISISSPLSKCCRCSTTRNLIDLAQIQSRMQLSHFGKVPSCLL